MSGLNFNDHSTDVIIFLYKNTLDARKNPEKIADFFGKSEATKRLDLEKGSINNDFKFRELLRRHDFVFRSRTDQFSWDANAYVKY